VTTTDFAPIAITCLTEAAGFGISLNTARAVVELVDSRTKAVDFDWVAAGELEPPLELEFPLHVNEFVINEFQAAKSAVVGLDVLGPNLAVAIPSRGTDWCAVGLSSGSILPAVYTLDVSVVGTGAGQVVGAGKGADGVANLRVTSGTCILPKSVAGFSPATGKVYNPTTKTYTDGPTTPIPGQLTIVTSSEGGYTVKAADGRVLFTQATTANDRVIVAFKNVKVQIQFAPNPISSSGGGGGGGGVGCAAGAGSGAGAGAGDGAEDVPVLPTSSVPAAQAMINMFGKMVLDTHKAESLPVDSRPRL
jgi:hypothetical protein